MASLQVLESCLALVPIPQSSFRRKSNWVSPESSSRRRVLKLRGFGRYSYLEATFRVRCGAQEDSNTQSSGEEPPESLFMKELKKRGMSPTSLLEETNRGSYTVDDDEIRVKEDASFFNRNAVSTEIEKSLANQRKRSMALNSEGLEGLIPRAKVLLTIGGTYFLGFGPLIFITIAFFCVVSWYFGQSFIHDGSDIPISPSQYVDPYTLLEDERISRMEIRLN